MAHYRTDILAFEELLVMKPKVTGQKKRVHIHFVRLLGKEIQYLNNQLSSICTITWVVFFVHKRLSSVFIWVDLCLCRLLASSPGKISKFGPRLA